MIIANEGLKDPRVGFVTVTGVETTPDLRYAKVFVSVLGGEAEREATMRALKHSHGYLQACLNARLHMRRTPQLTFHYDATLDNALRIERLMKREEAVLGSEPPEIEVGGARDEPPADAEAPEEDQGTAARGLE